MVAFSGITADGGILAIEFRGRIVMFRLGLLTAIALMLAGCGKGPEGPHRDLKERKARGAPRARSAGARGDSVRRDWAASRPPPAPRATRGPQGPRSGRPWSEGRARPAGSGRCRRPARRQGRARRPRAAGTTGGSIVRTAVAPPAAPPTRSRSRASAPPTQCRPRRQTTQSNAPEPTSRQRPRSLSPFMI